MPKKITKLLLKIHILGQRTYNHLIDIFLISILTYALNKIIKIYNK